MSDKLLMFLYYLLYLDDLYSLLQHASSGCGSWQRYEYVTLQLCLVPIILARRSFIRWTSLVTAPSAHISPTHTAAAAAAADSDVIIGDDDDDDVSKSGKLQSVAAGCSGRMSRNSSLH